MKEPKGFSLVELIVVIAIFMFVLTFGVPAYSNWKKKHDVTSQIEMLLGDINHARMMAYTEKVEWDILWNETDGKVDEYRLREHRDANSNGIIEGEEITIKKTVVTRLSLTPNPAGDGSIRFNCRGFCGTSREFYISPSHGAGVDCLSVSTTRAKAGKWNGSTCIEK